MSVGPEPEIIATVALVDETVTVTDETSYPSVEVTSGLPDIVAAAGPVGSSTVAPVITIDAKGLVTALSSASITGATLPVTTKGDLLGYGSSAARLAVGPQGYFLFGDDTQTLGLGWGRPLSLLDVIKEKGVVPGETDSTAKIQAGLDDSDGWVLIPPSTSVYNFTNLTISAYTALMGAGLRVTQLRRIAGSTGIAIREKTAAEGNANGAIQIAIRGFMLDCNGVNGNGIDVGNQGGEVFTTGATIQDVNAFSCGTGTAMNIKANAAYFKHIWGGSSAKGIVFAGDGANIVSGLWAENNTIHQLEILEPYSMFHGVQLESAVSDTNPLVYVTSGGNSIYGLYANYSGAAMKPKMVQLAPNGYPFYCGGLINLIGSFTDGFYYDGQSVGSGTQSMPFEFTLVSATQGKRININASTGVVTTASL